MKTLTDYTEIFRRNLFVLVGMLLSAYFSYHMVFGERSYLRLSALADMKVEAEAELVDLNAQRVSVEGDVVMLRPGSIDRDLLEERARVVLGLRYENESSVF